MLPISPISSYSLDKNPIILSKLNTPKGSFEDYYIGPYRNAPIN